MFQPTCWNHHRVPLEGPSGHLWSPRTSNFPGLKRHGASQTWGFSRPQVPSSKFVEKGPGPKEFFEGSAAEPCVYMYIYILQNFFVYVCIHIRLYLSLDTIYLYYFHSVTCLVMNVYRSTAMNCLGRLLFLCGRRASQCIIKVKIRTRLIIHICKYVLNML